MNKRPKISMPNLVVYLKWMPIFKWCVVDCGSKNGCKKNTCLKKINLCAQALCSICNYTNAIVNIIGWDKTI